MPNNGACRTRNDPYWIASASYTARCPNEGEVPWGWMPAGDRAISGAVVIQRTPTLDFLVVHDTSVEGDIRFSYLRFVDGVLSENNPVEWTGSTAPRGLEALERLSDTLFVAVDPQGNFYVVKMGATGATISAVATGVLPGYVGGTEIESFAIHRVNGVNLCIWATRGGPSTAAVIKWSTISDGGVISTVTGTVNFTTPFPTANQRHIAAMRVSETGKVYVTSTSDPGDDGPFSSAAYSIGQFDRVGSVGSFTLAASPEELYRTLSHKAEAIAGIPGDASKLGLILASDDENFGASIFLELAPIGRFLTVERTVRSYISEADAKRRAHVLAKAEAIAEIRCFNIASAQATPYCQGSYYSPPLTRTALSSVSQSLAQQQAQNAAYYAALQWCESRFDQQPPPVVDGESKEGEMDALIDETAAALIDEAATPLENE